MFHKHNLELIAKTYAEPVSEMDIEFISDSGFLQLLLGVTTYLWKCKDPNCNKIVKEECLGKEV